MSSRRTVILVIDDEMDILKALALRLSAAGFEAHVCDRPEAGLARARQILPDLVLLDIMMPGLNGFEVKKRLEETEETRDIPVIFLSAQDHPSEKVRGLEMGAEDYITKPFDTGELLARIRKILRPRRPESGFLPERRPSSRKRVLVVEDEPDVAKTLLFRIEQAGFEGVLAADARSALFYAKKYMPDLILLDLMLPDMPGEEVCKAVREDPDETFAATAIIMVTAKRAEVDRVLGKVLGADAYLTKPFETGELLETIRAVFDARAKKKA